MSALPSLLYRQLDASAGYGRKQLSRRRQARSSICILYAFHSGILNAFALNSSVLRKSSQRLLLSLGLLQAVFHHLKFGSRVVSVLDSGAEEPGFKSQPRRRRVTVLSKLFTPIVPLFTKQRNC